MEDHDGKSGYTSKTIEVLQPPSIVTHLFGRVSSKIKDTLFVATINAIPDQKLTSYSY